MTYFANLSYNCRLSYECLYIYIQNPLKSEYGHVSVKQQLFLFLILQDGILICKQIAPQIHKEV